MSNEITGKHVFIGFVLAFGTIIFVNVIMAVYAVRTFPGLEVKNSYIASQNFDTERDAQDNLNWQVNAKLVQNDLILTFHDQGVAIAPKIESAVFGRATNVTHDQVPEFIYSNGAFRAQVNAGRGNWNLRLKARDENGVLFQQRIVVQVEP